jgi:hypothetical protein
MALTITTLTVKDGTGASVTTGVASDGTNKWAAVGLLGADGTHFLPAMDAVARAGYAFPVGTYNSALPTLSDGQNATLQLDLNGRLIVALGTQLDAANDTVGAQPKAATSGGCTPSHLISAATTNATSLKASAGQVYGFQFTNKNTSNPAYVKLYNKASAPTVGTDTPVKVICVPAAASVSLPTVVVHQQPLGIAFGTGIAYAVTGGSADNDTTAVGAGDVLVEIDYK